VGCTSFNFLQRVGKRGNVLLCRMSFGVLTYNGFGLCVRRGFESTKVSLLTNDEKSTKNEAITNATLAHNPCYRNAHCDIHIL
jgi:hypothetical protein